ncbi:Diacylglycerol kinase [Komagataella phaffii CBS 7435]|uniref:Diacylglycerol kinase, localized to the endoplasmic reticulum (ER) n=2 Tax=Komagataella phaffii TaxID=460519 RepID=C4R3G5_KOMPG|nr:Diacylglycerol kinase, localized to the endoplasmic reticulum (ER) [Komagataella phaffii GS115]AOA64268.1 GQ67_03082T0 [Komagataella phaffii]CAH2450280.1 Diacylglycerol kinase [Komagataella phaffii CBS 7435]AOA69274.1 GQ68_03066T0 [Komagataella phaffii GS115]CAY70000.1 Diacylglycerol kinase, localized to the endoplasmic reticulum (ER) [Komagataella phaffii GS115]CCA40111.1 Diacylglycerol kinase [Komagataella phaffii CBS 7435]
MAATTARPQRIGRSRVSKLEERISTSSSYSSLSSLDASDDTVLSTESTSPVLDKAKNTSTSYLLLQSHKRFNKLIHKHELPRKLFHMSIGFFTLYLYTKNVQKEQIQLPLVVGFVVVFALDLIRFRWPQVNKLYCSTVGFLMREREVDEYYNGVNWYLLGLAVVFLFFKKDIAVMAVLLLSLSDTAASTVGRAWGQYTPKITSHKSLAGSLAACVVGILSCYLFYGYFVPNYPECNDIPNQFEWVSEKSGLNIHSLALLSGLVASVSEGIDLFNWDDNFTIPVLSAVFLRLVIKLTNTD